MLRGSDEKASLDSDGAWRVSGSTESTRCFGGWVAPFDEASLSAASVGSVDVAVGSVADAAGFSSALVVVQMVFIFLVSVI